MTYNYLIETSADGGVTWTTTFRVLTPEGVGEVVRILCQFAMTPENTIRVMPYAVKSMVPQ